MIHRLQRVSGLCVAALVSLLLTTPTLHAQELTQGAQDQPTRLIDRKRDFGRFQGPVPPLEIKDNGLFLGDIAPSSDHVRTVELCNRSLKPITILRTTTECSCTVMELETKVIPPGECIPFTVTYQANQNIAPFRREVRVFCQGYSKPFTAYVTGEVTYAVKINKNGLRGINQKLGLITLDSINGEPFSVLATNGEHPSFLGFDPDNDKPRNSYVLQYDWSKKKVTDLPRWMIIETDHADARMMDLRVIIHDVVQHNSLMDPTLKFRPIEDRILIPELRIGESEEISITVKGVGRGTADSVSFKAEGDGLDLEFVDRDDAPRSGSLVYRLKVTPHPGSEGFQHSIIRVTMNGETNGLDLFARVLPSEQTASN